MLLLIVKLVFYGPLTHFRSFPAQSVNLATLFLGKPPRQFTTALFESAEEGEWPKKHFHDQISTKECFAGCENRTRDRIPSGRASNRATAPVFFKGCDFGF